MGLNSEQALIQLILRNPHETVSLNRKGFKSKFFTQSELGKLYSRVYEVHTQFNSLPTDEEIETYGVSRDTSLEIEQTTEHLSNFLIEEYNKKFTSKVLVAAAEHLRDHGSKAAKEVALRGFSSLLDTSKESSTTNITDLNDDVLEYYNMRAKYKGQIIGIPTGFDILDHHTMGLQPGWLVVISGRLGSYKNWVLINTALSAWKNGNNVALFSCEMSKIEIALRIHALGANIPPDKIRHGNLSVEEYDKFTKYLEEIKSPPWGKLEINDNPHSIFDVDNELKAINEHTPMDIAFVDSVYRIESEGESDVSKQKAISRAGKDLAMKYKLPVVYTVQLNRKFAEANSTEKGKEQTTSGNHFIYGSDSYAHDADVMLMLNQPESYMQFNYNDMILTKFRHGADGIQYIIEINLNTPKISQVSTEEAKIRIVGKATSSTVRDEKIIGQAEDLLEYYKNQSTVKSEEIINA